MRKTLALTGVMILAMGVFWFVISPSRWRVYRDEETKRAAEWRAQVGREPPWPAWLPVVGIVVETMGVVIFMSLGGVLLLVAKPLNGQPSARIIEPPRQNGR